MEEWITSVSKLWFSYCSEYLSIDSTGNKIRLSDRKYSWIDDRIEERLIENKIFNKKNERKQSITDKQIIKRKEHIRKQTKTPDYS